MPCHICTVLPLSLPSSYPRPNPPLPIQEQVLQLLLHIAVSQLSSTAGGLRLVHIVSPRPPIYVVLSVSCQWRFSNNPICPSILSIISSPPPVSPPPPHPPKRTHSILSQSCCCSAFQLWLQEALVSDENPDMLDFSDAADGLARTTSNVSSTSDLLQRGQPGSPPPPPPLPPFDAFMRRSMLHRCFASIGKATIRRAFSLWNAPLTTKVADQCCLRLCCHLGCSPRSKQGCLSAYITPTLADILVAIHGVQAIVAMGPYIQQCSLAARPSSGTAAPALSCRSWSPSHPRLSERLTKCKPRSSSSTLTQVWPTCFLSSPCGAMHCLVGLPTCAFLRSRLPLLPASLCPSEFLCRLCYLWALSLCVTLLERAAFVCLQLLCPGCSVGQHGTSPKHCLAPMPWVLTHVKRKLSGLSGKSYR